MNKRHIFLDFTSLLDVFMIILFFFIIFGKIETDGLAKEIEEQENQIATQKEELLMKEDKVNEMLKEATDLKRNAQILLNEANEAIDRSGSNVDALAEFGESKNLKLSLNMEANSENWTIIVIKNDETISQISKSSISEMTKALKSAFDDNGYTTEDTILIELFYNATESGTTAAYNDINKMLNQIRNEYQHCFYSETDTSLL